MTQAVARIKECRPEIDVHVARSKEMVSPSTLDVRGVGG